MQNHEFNYYKTDKFNCKQAKFNCKGDKTLLQIGTEFSNITIAESSIRVTVLHTSRVKIRILCLIRDQRTKKQGNEGTVEKLLNKEGHLHLQIY